jgi:hypothetical protein
MVAGRGPEEAQLIVKVARSGGFAGLVAEGELDTTGRPDADRIESVLRALDPARLGSGRPQPDRYVYRIEVRDAPDRDATHFTVAEQDLDETTAWLLDLVLQNQTQS